MSDNAQQGSDVSSQRSVPGSPAPSREPWIVRYGWVIIFVVLVFFAGIVAGLYGAQTSGVNVAGLSRTQEPAGARIEIRGLGSRVVALEDRAAGLDARLARLRTSTEGSLAPRVDDAEGALDRLERDVAALPTLTRRLEAAEGVLARVKTLEAQLAAVDDLPTAVSGLSARLEVSEAQAQGLPGIVARVEQLESGAADTKSMAARLEVVEAAAQALTDNAPQADGVAELVARLERLEAVEGSPLVARLDALEGNISAGGTVNSQVQLVELRQRLSGLQDRLDLLEGDDQISSVQASVLAVEARIGALETGVAGSASADNVAGIASRVDELENGIAGTARADDVEAIGARIDPLEAALAETASATQIEAIGARIDPLEAALAETAGAAEVAEFEERMVALEEAPVSARRAAALVLAVGQLRGAVSTGRPYTVELEDLRALTPLLSDPQLDLAVAALQERASGGVPTFDDLQRRFVGMAARLVRVEGLGDDPDWVDKTLDRLSSVVSVRRVGDIEGSSVEAKVARAEARLVEGDLEAAVVNLSGLQGAVSLALEVWLGDARARLAADKALADMNERTTAHLGAS